jgi:hypothetical protein
MFRIRVRIGSVDPSIMPPPFNSLDTRAISLALRLRIFMAKPMARLLPWQSTRSIPRTLVLASLLLVWTVTRLRIRLITRRIISEES